MRRSLLVVALVGAVGSAARAEPPPDPVRVGLYGGAQFSVGGDATSPATSPAFGVRGGYSLSRRVTVEGEVEFAPATTRGDDAGVLIVGGRARALVHLPLAPLERHSVRPFVAVGAGGLVTSYASAMTERDAVAVPLRGSDLDALVEMGLGVELLPEKRLSVRVDGRWALAIAGGDAFGTPNLQLLVGVTGRFGGTPPPPPPDPPLLPDPDHDFLYGDADKCPEEAEDDDAFQDEDGCPDPDNDGDGVFDADDQCPEEAEDLNEIDDGDGCPDPDPDGDGILGSVDQCPDEPEDADGHADEDGCPDHDDDGDGIAGDADLCATTPETMNGFEDEDGCPDEMPKAVKALAGPLAKVKFKKGAAALGKRGKRALDKIVKVLAKHPSVRIRIVAHTDDKGEHDALVALSEQRAEAVKAYLVEKGIDEARIDTVGHGPDQPVTKRGKPRAVERIVLEIVVPK